MTTLKQLIESSEPLIVPGIYDGISARALAQTSFKAAYLGSHATNATVYGLPDVGYLTRDDIVGHIRRLAPLVEKPIIADGEGGFGNPIHVAKTVQDYEAAGAAAIHIEDHTFGKHLLPKWGVLPLNDAVDKIKAALDARKSGEFMVIARTDAFRGRGIEPVVERLSAFAAAGADVVFATGVGLPEITTIKSNVDAPLLALNQAGHPAQEVFDAGADLVVYYGNAYLNAHAAITATYEALEQRADLSELESGSLTTWEFDEFLGVDEVRQQARALGLIG